MGLTRLRLARARRRVRRPRRLGRRHLRPLHLGTGRRAGRPDRPGDADSRPWRGVALRRRDRRHPRGDGARGRRRRRECRRHRRRVQLGRATAALDGMAEPVSPAAGRRRGGGTGGGREPERAHHLCEALEPATARAGGAHLSRGDRPVGTARAPAMGAAGRLHPLGGLRGAPRRGAGAARSVAVPPRRTETPRAPRPRGTHRRRGECAGHVRRPGRSPPGRATGRHGRAARSDPGDGRPAGARPARAAARGDAHRRLDGRRRGDADAVANGRARRVRRAPLDSHAHDPTDRPNAGSGDRPHPRCRRELRARRSDARATPREPGLGRRRRRDRPGSHDRPAGRAPRTGRGGGDRVERGTGLDNRRWRRRGRSRSRRERGRSDGPRRVARRVARPRCSANSWPSRRRWRTTSSSIPTLRLEGCSAS